MADSPIKTAKPVTLANKIVTTLVTTFAECFLNARNSGTKLADFCAAAKAADLPVKPEPQDIEAIVAGVSARLAWNGTSRERANKSEARVLISSHAELPEGITAYKTATGMCGYHEAVKVARKIRELGWQQQL